MDGGPVIYGSVCSGIEAATVAWEPLGWKPRFFAEIDRFPSAVLSHRYPGVPNRGDFTQIGPEVGSIDLLVGGTPCQDFSLAGLRAGLAGERGNLTLKFLELLDRLRPAWVVWENVPGVLSDDGGRSFGAFLGGLAQLGYGWAYRVLDAQYFGVPQRRQRVFVVGYLGDDRPPGAVLFERHSLQGHPSPRREAESIVASALTRGLGSGGVCVGRAQANHLVASTIRSRTGVSIDSDCTDTLVVAHTLRGEGFDASEDGTGRGTPLVVVPIDMRQARRGETMTNHRRKGSTGGAPGTGIGQAGDPSPSLSTTHPPAIAFVERGRPEGRTVEWQEDLAYAQDVKSGGGAGSSRWVATFDERNLASGANRSTVDSAAPCDTLHSNPPAIIGPRVRRLTPRECERLQGFPDDWTLILTRTAKAIEEDVHRYLRAARPDLSRSECERLAKDSPRYRAIGNSMAVPVMRRIGARIERIHSL